MCDSKIIGLINIFQFRRLLFEFYHFLGIGSLYSCAFHVFFSSVSFVIFSSVKSFMQELLMFKLGYATEFPDDLDLRVNFDLKLPVAAGSFNPLLQFDHIGNKKFDQVCPDS